MKYSKSIMKKLKEIETVKSLLKRGKIQIKRNITDEKLLNAKVFVKLAEFCDEVIVISDNEDDDIRRSTRKRTRMVLNDPLSYHDDVSKSSKRNNTSSNSSSFFFENGKNVTKKPIKRLLNHSNVRRTRRKARESSPVSSSCLFEGESNVTKKKFTKKRKIVNSPSRSSSSSEIIPTNKSLKSRKLLQNQRNLRKSKLNEDKLSDSAISSDSSSTVILDNGNKISNVVEVEIHNDNCKLIAPEDKNSGDTECLDAPQTTSETNQNLISTVDLEKSYASESNIEDNAIAEEKLDINNKDSDDINAVKIISNVMVSPAKESKKKVNKKKVNKKKLVTKAEKKPLKYVCDLCSMDLPSCVSLHVHLFNHLDKRTSYVKVYAHNLPEKFIVTEENQDKYLKPYKRTRLSVSSKKLKSLIQKYAGNKASELFTDEEEPQPTCDDTQIENTSIESNDNENVNNKDVDQGADVISSCDEDEISRTDTSPLKSKVKRNSLPFKICPSKKFKYNDFVCSKCDTIFDKKVDLNRHLLSHIQKETPIVSLCAMDIEPHLNIVDDKSISDEDKTEESVEDVQENVENVEDVQMNVEIVEDVQKNAEIVENVQMNDINQNDDGLKQTDTNTTEENVIEIVSVSSVNDDSFATACDNINSQDLSNASCEKQDGDVIELNETASTIICDSQNLEKNDNDALSSINSDMDSKEETRKEEGTDRNESDSMVLDSSISSICLVITNDTPESEKIIIEDSAEEIVDETVLSKTLIEEELSDAELNDGELILEPELGKELKVPEDTTVFDITSDENAEEFLEKIEKDIENICNDAKMSNEELINALS